MALPDWLDPTPLTAPKSKKDIPDWLDSAPLVEPAPVVSSVPAAGAEPRYLSTFGQGVLKGAAGLADMFLNLPENVINIGKVAYGTAAGMAGYPERMPDVTAARPRVRDYLTSKGIISEGKGVSQEEFERVPTDITASVVEFLGEVVGGGGVNPAALARGTTRALVGTGPRVAARRAEATAARRANAVRDATLREAQAAGYVVPPTTTRPTWVNRAIEGLAGKLTTAQQAAMKNQLVTNRLAREAVGLAPDTPLEIEALQSIRKEAGKAYEAVKGAGTITPDAHFTAEVDAIAAKYAGAARDFPQLARPDVQALVDGLKGPTFGSDSAVDAIRIMRENADKAFKAGDAGLGRANREAAEALEGILERHLARTGAPPHVLTDYRQARELIAKTYSVENALTRATGSVSAPKLAAQLQKGEPLTGELKTAAKAGGAFPKATAEVRESMPGISPLDYTVGAGLGVGVSPSAFALPLVRPAARAALLSTPYQRLMTAPTYGVGPMAGLGARLSDIDIAQILTPRLGAANALNQLLNERANYAAGLVRQPR